MSIATELSRRRRWRSCGGNATHGPRRDTKRGNNDTKRNGGCNPYEKLVLVVLAARGKCEQGGIRERLDPKVATLLPREVLITAIQRLEHIQTVAVDVKDRVAYRIADRAYKAWIAETKDQFSIVRGERAILMGDLALSRFAVIDRELRGIGEPEWIFEFLFRDRGKWRRLVRVSQLFEACREAATRDEIASAGFSYLNSILRRIPATVSQRRHAGADRIGVYEITVPEIHFVGFDRILGVVIPDVMGGTPDAIRRCWRDTGRPPLVLISTPKKREFLANYFRNEIFQAIILDANDVKNITLADEPGRALLDGMASQVDLAALSPFQTAGPVSDMFYGRTEELTLLLASLERPNQKNHAVVGPRRVGKTSLLHKVRAELRARKGWDTVYIDVSSFGTVSDPTERLHAFFQALLDKLDIPGAGTPQGFLAAMGDAYGGNRKSRLAIFVDEVDDLLETHARDGQDRLPRTIRTMISEFDVKVVLVGYKTLYFQMHNEKSALFNMSDRLPLAALDGGERRGPDPGPAEQRGGDLAGRRPWHLRKDRPLPELHPDLLPPPVGATARPTVAPHYLG
uniref:TniB protein n=1 Tax=Candidatus Kentrum sp. TC TaxID=2126339 RepID=A0A451AE49_9GAMM|nr:MAG: TniB protein [Candidatus Kentron sp. TC]